MMAVHNAPESNRRWRQSAAGQRHRRAQIVHAMLVRNAENSVPPRDDVPTLEQIFRVLNLDAAVRTQDGLVTVRLSDLPPEIREMIR